MPTLSRLTYRLAAAYCCFGAVLFVFGPCLTAMVETFRVELGRFGLLWTCYALGLTPAVLLAGWFSESVGRRPLLLGSVLLIAASCALIGASPHLGGFWSAMAAMVLLGASGGAFQTVLMAAVADDNQPAPEFALNLTYTLLAIGAVLGPAATSALLRARLPWQWAFFGLAMVFVLVFISLTRERVPGGSDEPLTLHAARALLRTPVLWLLIAVTALYCGAESGLVTWVSAFGEKTFGMPRALAGMSVAIFWAMMIVGRAATTLLVTRVRLEGLLATLAGAAALVTTLLTRATGGAFVLMGAAVAGLFMSGIAPLTSTDCSRQFTRYRAAAFGLALSGIGLGNVLVPAAMGAIADAATLRHALLVPPGLLGAVAVAYLLRLPYVRAGAAPSGEKKGANYP